MAETPKTTPRTPEPDVEAAAEKRELTTEGTRSTFAPGKATDPNYKGPYLVQTLHKREQRS